ncbi:MAG: hypothetical protein AB8I80_05365 [Anaerolineae bacterium]
MKRTTWGLLAMCLSLLLGTAIALGSLISVKGQLNTADLVANPLSVPTLLVSCLDPLAILLEIAAIVLVVSQARRYGTLHHRLAWTAAILYLLWAAANLLGFLPLSLRSAQTGSLHMALTGQWIKAGAALLAYTVPALLVLGLGNRTTRAVTAAGWLISAIGNFGTVATTIPAIALEPVVSGDRVIYAVQFSVDYAGGFYPLLLTMGYIGGTLYLAVYLYLAWQQRRTRPLERAASTAG